MERFVAAENSEVGAEVINLEQLQMADDVWHRTVDRMIESQGESLRTLQEHMQEMDSTLDTLGSLPQKHATEILGRRTAWVQEQQALVEEQIQAMEARKEFAAQEKDSGGVEGVREIVEMYDEDLHGSLDTPAVRAEVHRQRQYYGPPRCPEEVASHNMAFKRAQAFAHQEGQDDVDSDDEDPTIDPTHVPHTLQGTGFHGESRDPMLLSTDALDAEVERLLLALNSTGTSGNSQPDSSKPSPLVEELQDAAGLAQSIRNAQLEDECAGTILHSQGATESPYKSKNSLSSSMCAEPSASGLKPGFFRSSAKPKRSILKKTDSPGGSNRPGIPPNACTVSKSALQPATQYPTEARDQSTTGKEAFNGFVRERDVTAQVTQDTQVTAAAEQLPARVSKFKARMAAQRQQQSS